MENVQTLIVGAGVSGLATAASLPKGDYLILERDREVGGYCKTVTQAGFTWDYSGHFFHFKHPEIEEHLRARMPGQVVRTVQRQSRIAYKGKWIDFPFQKNIHQLPQDEFIDCLYDLYFAKPTEPERNFKEMLFGRFGRSICEKFLIPYNEKLYACDLSQLDRDAMGRFFPHADVSDVIRNMRAHDSGGYNATFTYPQGGAIQYVYALAKDVRPEKIALGEPLVALDPARRVARTADREIRFERLVSSAPLHKLLALAEVAHDASVFSWNQVLVFNLGFDRKGPAGVHWVYFPDRTRCFYRIGFYDNIFDTDRMSLYVELGFPNGAEINVAQWRERVLEDLRAEGIVQEHQLVAEHSVVMDPAYVHITQASNAERARVLQELNAQGIFSIGRYGGWTYCSIEDNIVEARALTAKWK